MKHTKRLTLKSETIRRLASDELANVIGGAKASSAPGDPCQGTQPASPYVSCMGTCGESCGTCASCDGCTLYTFAMTAGGEA